MMTYQLTHKELNALCLVFLNQVDWYNDEELIGLDSEECETLYHKLNKIKEMLR